MQPGSPYGPRPRRPAPPVPPLLLTVTHVNPVRFGILPVDQDTGDEDGALVFNILAVYMPLECMEKPDGLNCGNLEVCICAFVSE